jgi:ubiquinone/menaquinone biosynthesis C-methylase UbiE
MPTFEEVYARYADHYDRLVNREDYQQNILPALNAVVPLAGLDVVEMGAGTGRLTRLFAPVVRRIDAFDRSAHMLSAALTHLRASGLSNWSLGVADNQSLPVESASADLAIAGWSFGHATEWTPDVWPREIGAAVREMLRVVRPGGTAIILETMGTGSETPAPPSAVLADYYRLLETEFGFTGSAIRTDYRFESPEEGAELVRFFFSDEALAARILSERMQILPECTGIWWRRV